MQSAGRRCAFGGSKRIGAAVLRTRCGASAGAGPTSSTVSPDAEMGDFDSWEETEEEDDWMREGGPATHDDTVFEEPEEPDNLLSSLGVKDPIDRKYSTEAEFKQAEAKFEERIRNDPEFRQAIAGKENQVKRMLLFPKDESDKSPSQNWVRHLLNESRHVDIAIVPSAIESMKELAQFDSNYAEKDREFFEKFHDGDVVFSGSVILSRYLAIHPPLVELRGKTVIELGGGCGMPSVVAGMMGASRVLLQDKLREPLEMAVQSAVRNKASSSLCTLCCDWKDLPDRLASAEEETLQQFREADIILGSVVLYSQDKSESVADVLDQLLKRPSQAAYLVEPYRYKHFEPFEARCRSHGLDVHDTEICTWEPMSGDTNENDPEWYCRLATIRRP